MESFRELPYPLSEVGLIENEKTSTYFMFIVKGVMFPLHVYAVSSYFKEGNDTLGTIFF